MNPERLADFLRHQMPDARDVSVTDVARIPGGASRETWSFDASWVDANTGRVERSFIARRDPTASLLDSNNDLEFELYSALDGSGVPAPRVHWIDREGKWLDRPFYVMERLPGQTDGRTLATSPEYRDALPHIAEQKAQILAKIHAFDIDRIPSLERPASPEAAALHEVERWERTMRQDTLEPQPVLEIAFAWLKRHLPPPPEQLALVHADYRTGNFLYDKNGINGILDWEMAHAGDPIEDLGWAVMKSWRWGGGERVGGLSPRNEFIAMYEEASGRRVESETLRFWEIFSNVKFAIIFITGTRSIVQSKTNDLLLALTAFINPGLEVELLELIG